MKKLTTVVILLGTVLALLQPARADSILNVHAKLRAGVHVDSVVPVIENTNAPVNGRTLLCLPGLAHTGYSFRNLAEAVITNGLYATDIRHIILLDMPNRGGTTTPYGRSDVRFGDLDLYDYASLVRETMVAWQKSTCNNIDTILAHSMGGGYGQLLTVLGHKMRRNRDTLADAFGTTKARMIGSTSPSGVFDPFSDLGLGILTLDTFTNSTPYLGTFVAVDDSTFAGFFFTDANGNFVPGTPDISSIPLYSAKESYAAAKQAIGTEDLRPNIPPGVFAPSLGTDLKVFVGDQDVFNPVPDFELGLYQYLIDDASATSGFVVYPGIHDQFIVDPNSLLPYLDL